MRAAATTDAAIGSTWTDIGDSADRELLLLSLCGLCRIATSNVLCVRSGSSLVRRNTRKGTDYHRRGREETIMEKGGEPRPTLEDKSNPDQIRFFTRRHATQQSSIYGWRAGGEWGEGGPSFVKLL